MDACKEASCGGMAARVVLQNIEDDFWRWRLQDSPEFASAVGDQSHNDTLESFDITIFQARKVKVQDYLDKLQTVDRSQLTQAETFDLDIFTDHLQTFKDGAVFDMYQSINPVNFLESTNADSGRLQVNTSLACVTDFVGYLERLKALPKQIDEKIALMKKAIELGHTLNKSSVVGVPAQIDRLLSVTPVESSFYAPVFTTKLDTLEISQARRKSLRTSAGTALGQIKRALFRLKVFLEEEYLPVTRLTYGVWGWPEGPALYEQCLRYHTSTNMTPHQVHDLGVQEMTRIAVSMKTALKRLGFEGTVRQFYDTIRGHPNYRQRTSEDLLASFRHYIFDVIYPKLPMLFKDIPDLPLRVAAMPYDGPLGEYLGGTPDGRLPGTFYANVAHPEKCPTINIMALLLHETVPGHHLQSVYSMSANLPAYRAFTEDSNYHRMPATFPINTAYIEGWGLYAEFLGEELGMYTDDYMLMGRYSEELFRASRLVVDTGLHYFGWDRDRAIQFIMNTTIESREAATAEVDRYLTWPGQATAYKIGEIKLKLLREKAADALGDRFDIRDFHSVILKNGGMSLNLLERLVDSWIASHRIDDRPASDEDNGGVLSTASPSTAPDCPVSSIPQDAPDCPVSFTPLDAPDCPVSSIPRVAPDCPVSSTLLEAPDCPVSSTPLDTPDCPVSSIPQDAPDCPVSCNPQDAPDWYVSSIPEDPHDCPVCSSPQEDKEQSAPLPEPSKVVP